ncbi:MAG: 6-phosphogluconolactonase [Gammaproteobacteria bacterium]|jgi:6-phosphogluconolactonase
MISSKSIHWHSFADSQALAEAAARAVLKSAREATAVRREFRIVLAGGRTPKLAYGLLAEAEAEWTRWRIYFGDERCLPPQHPERNSEMARSVWLDRAGIPPDHIFPIPAELGPEAAAAAYSDVVRHALPFDLVLLGMGEDGHTASLFPGHLHRQDELVHAVYQAPKPPAQRVTLSAAALSNARRILILVSGSAKREAVRRWRSAEALPVAGIRGPDGVEVLIDRDAEA